MAIKDEFKLLSNLSQSAAAQLLGMNATTLRSSPCPRTEEGRYSGPEIVAWRISRIPDPKLSDEMKERLLTVVEHFECDYPQPLLDVLNTIADEHGDAGLAMFGRKMMDHLKELLASHPCYRIPTEAQIRAGVEADVERRLQSLPQYKLHIAVQCRECGRVRRGDKWLKTSPPDGYDVVGEDCPRCREKQMARK